MKTEHDFRYCPMCASQFEKKEHNLFVCPNCHLHFYINPKLCNSVILENEKGEILLVRRARDPHKGLWDLAGGFVDLSENLESSVHRELMEELHIKIDQIRYLGSVHDSYIYQGITMQTLCALFFGKIDSNAPIKVDDDVSESHFFAKKDIPYDDIAFEGIREGLKKYLDSGF
jgi:NADH pyrophosphatase NudC (nudix superfamily)